MRLADGRVFTGPLAPERHRALQLGILHQHTAGLVELAAGVRRDGRLHITTRRRADHFLPGGQVGRAGWLRALLALAARHADRGEEVFVAPAARAAARGDKHAVGETRFLWVDVDHPDQLPALWALLAERPCHLLVSSGGSGGVHAYWKLDQPLPATPHDRDDRRARRADRARAPAADPPPRHGRRRQAERRRPGVRGALAGDAPRRHGQRQDRRARQDPRSRPRAARVPDRAARRRPARSHPAGRGPRPRHRRRAPIRTSGSARASTSSGSPASSSRGTGSCAARPPATRTATRRARSAPTPSQGWRCHAGGCGARGAIYDLASVVLGGPWGPELRGEAFKRARAYVAEVFGEPPSNHNHEGATTHD